MKRILVLVFLVLFLGSFVSAEYAAADRFVNNKNGTVTDSRRIKKLRRKTLDPRHPRPYQEERRDMANYNVVS